MTDNLGLYANPGHDRDCAEAMLSQVRLGANPVDDIQLRHLLAIGWRAGRAVTDADREYDQEDRRLGRWGDMAIGAIIGLALAVVGTFAVGWIFG